MTDRREDVADDNERVDRIRLGRRSYLGALGASAIATTVGLAGTGGATATGSEDYDVVKVPAGDRFEKVVSSGERFENVLIDISAEGATFDIEATGSDWVVRNVGIKGVWDQYEKREPFRAAVDRGSTGRIENFYFADGAPDDAYPGVTGIYVYRNHAGTLRIDRTNIQDMPDNAIYASTPGYPADNDYNLPEGGGGVVEITNSYAADCQAAHFRLGTAGSFARNCVAVGGEGGHRGFLGRFDTTRAIDCDFVGHSRGDVVCGTFGWPSSTSATVSVEDCRFETVGDLTYTGDVVGESTGTPRTEPPAGVPRSPEEAAAGGADSDSSDGSTDDSTGTSLPSTLTVETTEGGPLVEYEFTVEGTVANGDAADSNDTITDEGETATVTGATGNGYTDSFQFEGELTDWSASVASDHYRVLVDGAEIDPTDAGGKTLTIETTESGPLVEYEFTVDGSVTKRDAADGNDTVTETDGTATVTGVTGNGYTDSFRFEGDLTDWTASVASDHYRVLVDGEEIDATGVGGPTTLTVETDADSPAVSYEFSVDGTVSRGPTAEGGSSIASDTISGEDPATVSGVTGRGYADDFEFEGTLLNWSADVDADEYRLLLDGETVDPSEI
jgi:hypothetical protein